ncbi:MAG: phage tail tape measure protein [Candidatus Anammoxibacter sp.]
MDIAAVGFILSKPIKSAMDFEEAMADVRKTMNDLDEKGVQKLSKSILKLSRITPTSAVGLAAIAAEGGKLGITIKDLFSFMQVVNKATVAWEMSSGMAARQLGLLSIRMGIPLEKIEELADAINFLADSTAAQAPAMLNILSRVAGQFKLLNIPPEAAAGLAAFANQLEATPQLAASGLNMMLVRMAKIPGMAEKLLAAPEKTIRTFLKTLEKMDKIKRMRVIEQLFGQEAGRFVLKASEGMLIYEEAMSKVADKIMFLGSMQNEYDIRIKTSTGKLAMFKNRFNELMTVVGGTVLPQFKLLLSALALLFLPIIFLTNHFPFLTGAIFSLVGALVLWRIVTLASAFATVQLKLALLAIPASAKLSALAVNILKFAMIGLNFVMRANPIGLFITGMAIAIAGIIALYKNLKAFRDLVDKVVGSVKGFFGGNKELKAKFEQKTTFAQESGVAANGMAGRKGADGIVTVRAEKGTQITDIFGRGIIPDNLGVNNGGAALAR